jgi:hypothetical protein
MDSATLEERAALRDLVDAMKFDHPPVVLPPAKATRRPVRWPTDYDSDRGTARAIGNMDEYYARRGEIE